MKNGVSVTLISLLLVAITGWLLLVLPWQVTAEEPVPLAGLQVALWPEYDRPALLVIVRGLLADHVALPASVQLDLPPDAPDLHAVAYLDESRQTLIDLPNFRFETIGARKTLTLSTPARQFHVEYYSDAVIKRQGMVRSIAYAFTATVAIADLQMELQQPVGASDFDSNPPPDTIETRSDGLAYAIYRIGALAAGDSRSLQVTYRRTTDALSVADIAAPRSATPPPAALEPPASVTQSGNLLWLVAAVIAVAVVGVVAFNVGRRSQNASAVPCRQRATEKTASAAYCYGCGTRLRPEGSFCHVCGAPRRVG